MTTINATINSQDFSGAAKRIDYFAEGPINRFELLLLNDSGASQILEPNYVVSDLGINGAILLEGHVDDVLPEVSDPTAVFNKMVMVKGRSYGRDLANYFLVKKYVATPLNTMIDDVLSIVGSEILPIGAMSPTPPLVDVDFNKTYLLNGFAEAIQRVGYDFSVDNDKQFNLWNLEDAPDTEVLLKAVDGDPNNNILDIKESVASIDLKNWIRIDAGSLDDHWTEQNASDWVTSEPDNSEIVDDSTVYVKGGSSLRVDVTSIAPSGPQRVKVYLPFPKYNHDLIDFSEVAEVPCSIWATTDSTYLGLSIWLKDDEGNEYIRAVKTREYAEVLSSLLVKTDFKMGVASSGWTNWAGVGFTWKIVQMGVIIWVTGNVTDKHVWFDGLEVNNIDVFAVASDATSIAAYGARLAALSRTDIKSQKQLQEITEHELLNRKDPTRKLTLTCTFQSALKYAGHLVHVLAPSTYIGYGSTPSTWRILTIHSAAEPGKDLMRGHDAITELELVLHNGGVGADPTRFKLVSAPQAAINIRHEQRLNVLEKSLTGSDSIVGGGASGGWNGGLITSPIELKIKFPYLDESQGEMYTWMFADPEDLPDPEAYIRFADTNETLHYTDIYGVIVSNGVDEAPAAAFNHHIVCRKDLILRGMVNSYEGILALQGGNAGPSVSGWSPTDNPMIWLSKGGVLGSLNELEIRTITQASPRVWGYGGLKCGTIYVDTFKKTNGDTWDFAGSPDKTFNSILLTEPTTAAVKIGLADGTTYVALSRSGAIAAFGRDLYLGTESGYKVEIQRALQVDGALTAQTSLQVGTSTAAVTLTTGVTDGIRYFIPDGSDKTVALGSTGHNLKLVNTDIIYANEFRKLSDGSLWNMVAPDVNGYITLPVGLNLEDSNVKIYRPTDGTAANQNSIRVQTPSGGALIVERTLAVGESIGVSIATGTAPITTVSTTMCTNLNADRLDGYHASEIIAAASGGTVDWSAITNKPSTFPPEAHNQAASTITSGTFDSARIPNIFDQNLNTSNDAIFNSVVGTSTTAGLKAGSSTNTVSIVHNGSNGIVSSQAGWLQLSSNNGVAVYGGNLQIFGGYHVIPESANGGQLGNSSVYWYASYVNNVYGKNPYTFGCERAKSNQEWLRKFTTREQAEEALTHQVTKERRHTHYDPKDERKIVCTCGKTGYGPCPEHEEAWNDLYAVHLGDCVEASSFLTLELDAELLRTRSELAALREEFEAFKKQFKGAGA